MDNDLPCVWNPLVFIVSIVITIIICIITAFFDLPFNYNNIISSSLYWDSFETYVLLSTFIMIVAIMLLAITVLHVWKKVEENARGDET